MFIGLALIFSISIFPGEFSSLPIIKDPIHPTRLLVKPKPGISREFTEKVHRKTGAKILFSLPQIGWQIIEVPKGTLQRSRQTYLQSGLFSRVDFDEAKRLAYDPNDEFWPYMWNLKDIKANLAWDIERGKPSVKVAIMDTGVLVTHPDLADNIWVNPNEIPNNKKDDDNNGYVDDVNGYDFAYNDSNPDDVHGHGTACAGIVAAIQDNTIGVTGVAPFCEIVAVKAARDDGYFYESANVPALVYCADMGFKVISMSFFSDEVTAAERDAINYCFEKGTLPVAAAGNSSSVLPYYPAAYDNTLAVAANDSSSTKAWFSNFGTWVDVAAPGVGIPTTTNDYYYTFGFAGTSAACPHAAGLAALLFSAKQDATPLEVRAAIEDTAITVNQYPFGEYVAYGYLDCFAAVQRILGQSSSSKPAKILFSSPVAGRLLATGGTRTLGIPITIYGIGFEPPNEVRAFVNGKEMKVTGQTRYQVDVLITMSGELVLKVNENIVGSMYIDSEQARTYAPSDASTLGALCLGGFFQLYRNDGNFLECTRREEDGIIYLEIPVRKVNTSRIKGLEIEFTRKYVNTNGTEYIELYDWSTWSYPYGSFVTIASTPVNSSEISTVKVNLANNPQRFFDDEGTLYFRVITYGAKANAKIFADSFRVKVKT